MIKSKDKYLIRLVDDNEQHLMALAFFLQTEGWRVESYRSSTEYLLNVKKDPGCLILDIKMPAVSGAELQEILNKRGYDLPIIFLTGHGDLDLAVQVFRRGAVDFLQKPFVPEELNKAIERAIELDEANRTATKKETESDLYQKLTPREKEVLKGVAERLPNSLIAEHLNLSERTVEFHRFSGLRKLGIKKVDELIEFLKKIKH